MDNPLPVRLTLVSASPRRRALIEKLRIPFDVAPSQAAERWRADDAHALAMQNARRKVEKSVYIQSKDRILLGADTIICGQDFVFGKPAGNESARRMLTVLSGQKHTVITGMCLSGPDQNEEACLTVEAAAESKVSFRTLDSNTIDDYIRSGEWMGKAGAYAIQESGHTLIERFEGDYDNIVGLPVQLIHDLLQQHFSHCRFL